MKLDLYVIFYITTYAPINSYKPCSTFDSQQKTILCMSFSICFIPTTCVSNAHLESSLPCTTQLLLCLEKAQHANESFICFILFCF